MLIIAAIGNLAVFFSAFFLPGYESYGQAVASLEVLFGLWLLVKGVKVPGTRQGSDGRAAISQRA